MALRFFERPGGNGRQLGHQPHNMQVGLIGEFVVIRIGVERTHSTHQRRQHAHWVCIDGEALENLAHILVHHRVPTDVGLKLIELFLRGQFTVDQQIRHFQKTGFGREVFDRIAPVAKDSFFTVQKRDSTLGGPRIFVAFV